MAYVDEQGLVTLTNEIKNKVDTKYLSDIMNLIYPVGAIYMSMNNTNPSLIFGGTWEQIQDRFLLAAGNTYAAGATGGEANHILTIDEIPAHTHKYAQYKGSSGWSGNSPQRNFIKTTNTDGYSDTDNSGYMTTMSTGEGQPHNNMPPYLVVYMWRRAA